MSLRGLRRSALSASIVDLQSARALFTEELLNNAYTCDPQRMARQFMRSSENAQVRSFIFDFEKNL